MKKNDLKNLIKPLVKECINEVLIEEGLLTEIVSQVATGMSSQPLVENRPAAPAPVNNNQAEKQRALKENRRKLLDAIGGDAYNGVDLFEGTTPAPGASQEAPAGSVDLGNPSDAGVDISSILGGASQIWKAMK